MTPPAMQVTTCSRHALQDAVFAAMPATRVQPAARFQSSRSYLFVGVAAVTAGALTYRHSLGTLRPLRTLRTLSTRRATIASAEPPQQANTAVMFGGGKGLEVPAEGTATAAMIFLHGLGDSGAGWAPAFPLQGLRHVRTVLPSAVEQPVTINMGYKSPSWFDLHGLDENSPDDEAGILESVARVNRIIDNQVAEGIPSERIVVAGFSQGGAVALTAALRSSRKLAGVVALSSWLPLRAQYPAQMTQDAKDAEMFMGHGTADQMVGFKFGHMSAEFIQSLDRKVTFKSYPGLTHSASGEELEDVRQFVLRVLPQT